MPRRALRARLPAAPAPGRGALRAGEGGGEVAGIAEAAAAGDLGDGDRGVAQQLLRPFDPEDGQVGDE